MDWYTLFKFVHVAAAIIWIGAGFGMVVLGVAAKRAGDRDASLRVIQQVIFMAPRVFMPASIAAFVFGLIVAFLGHWNALWIWLGLIGFAASFVSGNFLIRPRAEQFGMRYSTEGNSDALNDLGTELLSIAEFDYVVLFVIVADMVYKPSFSDWPLLLVMVIVLAAAGAYFLAPVVRKTMAAPGGMGTLH